MMGAIEAARAYYKGLKKKLEAMERLVDKNTGEEKIRLQGKVEGIKLAIQMYEYFMGEVK